MAQLPDSSAIAPPAIGDSGRPIASYDVTGYARGAAALGAGAEKLGQGIEKAAKDVAVVYKDDLREQVASATSDLLAGKVGLDAGVAVDTDYATVQDRYRSDIGKLQETAGAKITDPTARERWQIAMQPQIAHGLKTAEIQAFRQASDANKAYLSPYGDGLIKNAMATGDPVTGAAALDAYNTKVDSLVSSRAISNVEAMKFKRDFAQQYATASAMRRMDTGDWSVLDEMRSARPAGTPVLDRILSAEGTAKNPESSAEGVGQFIKTTWLDVIKRNRPDLVQGKSDREILALRSNPQLARDMTETLRQENVTTLTNNGVDPTPGAQYLAHFLGAGAATAVLKADPNAPIGSLVSADAIGSNRKVLEGKTAGQIAAWADKKMEGVSDAGPSESKSIYGVLTSLQLEQLVQRAERQKGAALIDFNRQNALAEKQATMISDQQENDIFKQIATDPSKVTAQSIATNDKMSLPARQRLMTLLEKTAKGDHDTASYGSGFYQLFQAVHAGPDDPRRITDPAELYSHVGPNGDLTLAGMDKLRQEISGKKTPDGAAEGEMKKQFLANAKGQISGSNDGLHIKDPKGDELYLKFMAQALPAYDQGRKDGKSPAQLLNPDSPDYVGKSISTFKRPMAEWFSDTINADTAPAKGKGFDIASIKSVEDAVKAHQSGQITGEQARALAVEKGWAKPRPAPEERPQVPRFQQ